MSPGPPLTPEYQAISAATRLQNFQEINPYRT
jgi:hypothetical protein